MTMHTKRKTKGERVNIRLERETKERLERRAAKDRRSVSDYVRLLIERALARAA